jgi:hypothetical protein
MALFRRRRVSRNRHGTYTVILPDPERQLLGNLVDQLRDLLLESTDDPTVRRLFPAAYNEDAERDREYQQLVRDDLLAGRLASLGVLEETLETSELSEVQLTAWLGAVNDLRLVLGTRLDVGEEPVEIAADDPDVTVYAVYEYLGFLLSELVDALSEGLPEPG